MLTVKELNLITAVIRNGSKVAADIFRLGKLFVVFNWQKNEWEIQIRTLLARDNARS